MTFLERNRHTLLLSGPEIYISGHSEELTNKNLCFQVALSYRDSSGKQFGDQKCRPEFNFRKSTFLVDLTTSFDDFLARKPPILPTFPIWKGFCLATLCMKVSL